MPTVAIGKSLLGPGRKSYTITDFLGKGAFGEVYRAVGDGQGDIIAVKVLPTSEIDETSKVALLNEMSAATKSTTRMLCGCCMPMVLVFLMLALTCAWNMFPTARSVVF